MSEEVIEKLVLDWAARAEVGAQAVFIPEYREELLYGLVSSLNAALALGPPPTDHEERVCDLEVDLEAALLREGALIEEVDRLRRLLKPDVPD